ncbi:MAG: hydrogenase maturation nickel metallochaperone HypA [Syntrophomonadaceae bacterium]|nr:hydrogenase maturation nickel metallochaperone HypA [Syntrophomonadaceae bacterium]
MHELGLMQQVVQILQASVQKEGLERVNYVKLVVGQMTAAQPDALQFAFEVFASMENWLKGAVLEIEEREIKARCLDCGELFTVVEYRFICSECGSLNHELESGRELFIDYYEGDK